jgi:hypothetical protein
MKHWVASLLLFPVLALAATPQDAVVSYTAPLVDATHSAATSCTLDRASTSLGVVTPGQTVTAAAPDFGTYTFGLTCSNSAGASTRVTFPVTIAPATLPPNNPTQFTLTFKCSQAQGATQPTCVQS